MYKKTYTTKIIKTEHEITIYSNSRAIDIRQDLHLVPDEAKLIEVSEPNEDNLVVLTFREETIEK